MQLDSKIDISVDSEVYNPSDDSFLLLKVIEVKRDETLLDMGSGSGLIAIHAARAGAKVTATDLNPFAVDCIKRNAARNDARVSVVQSDLFSNVSGIFDVISFNPPYLPGARTSTSWIEKAWSGGEEGGETAIRFLDDAWRHLAPGGRIFMILSSIGGLMSVLKSARERYEATMLVEQRMFFESIFAYSFKVRGSQI